MACMGEHRTSVTVPTWKAERALRARGWLRVAGVDEVGRGPLAGPVMAGAVMLPSRRRWMTALRDSKQLTARAREELDVYIRAEAAWGIASVSPQVIDQIGIAPATRLAMRRAVELLMSRFGAIDALIVDGRDRIGDCGVPQETVIDGDALCVSVAAASIIAKVARDEMMCRMDERFPAYGFASNKGYASAGHRAALIEVGGTTLHRLSFAPVREALRLRTGQSAGSRA